MQETAGTNQNSLALRGVLHPARMKQREFLKKPDPDELTGTWRNVT